MNRTKKNIIMIVIAVVLAGCMVFTAHSAGASLSPFSGMPQMMQNGPDGSGSGNMPAPPSGDSGNTGSEQDQSSGNQNAENNSSGNADNKPPAPPSGDSGSGNMPAPPSGDGEFKDASISDISVPYFTLFGVEGLALALILMYLIMSDMNRKTLRETFSTGFIPDETASLSGTDLIRSDAPDADHSSAAGAASGFSPKKIVIFAVAAILIACGLTFGQATLATTAFAPELPSFDQQMPGGSDSQNGGQDGNGQNSVQATGATTVDGTEETLNDTYTSSNADENAILVTNGGVLTLDGATIDKKSGDSSNTGSSDFSGVNAGLLVQEDSSATVKNATVKTSAKGANAVFATGENAKVTISDSTITTTGEASSRGLDATYGGTIEASNVQITTQGGSCAAMATDRGEGTVSATKSTLETNGAGSPLIYSTGDITLSDSTGTANGAQIAVVEGKNSAKIESSKVTCSGAGNRGDVDIAGVMIYQSMSGDANEGTGNFTAKDSTLTISKDSRYYKTAPMFFITNTDAVIDLQDTDLDFGSGVLLNAQGTSEWGQEGSNGGNVTFNATDENLTGDIRLDEISTLNMTMSKSTYKGTINGDNTAKSISLTIDKDSKLTLTGDSYVASLEDADSTYSNIDFNGHKLYVNGKAIN